MNWRRLYAIVLKELRQLRRDRVTLAMIVGIPVMQLVLFGYAINLNLRGLSAGIADESGTAGSRALVMDMLATGVIRPVAIAHASPELVTMLRRGQISIGVSIPPDFERRRLDGREAVQILVDGSDTVVQSAALQLAQVPIDSSAAARVGLQQRLGPDQIVQNPISVLAFYNPERRSAINIVPGLIGVILTMTMVLFTGVAIVRERERGTMENLLATPARPFEVMLGKIVPYILIGYVQVSVILLAARLLFDVPMIGSMALLSAVLVLFIAANLAVGFTFSTLARNQLQAMQLTFFFFLPSILLSGFMFPFRGMPRWAQWVGEALPLTHFLRIVRGIMLKGNDLAEITGQLWPIALFMLAAGTLAMKRYRQTVD